MGVAFSHCTAQWAYSGFMSFRQKIASTILGKPCDLYQMYKNDKMNVFVDHPLYGFLMHSDCDGELTCEAMVRYIPALSDILGEWTRNNSGIDFDFDTGWKLIAGMKEAVRLNENLEFH